MGIVVRSNMQRDFEGMPTSAVTPARFARGYLRFLEDGHRRGSETTVDPARMSAFRTVLGWLASQERLDETRFRAILTQRSSASNDSEIRWVCAHILQLWRLQPLRRAYGQTWADAEPGDTRNSDAPWDVAPEILG